MIECVRKKIDEVLTVPDHISGIENLFNLQEINTDKKVNNIAKLSEEIIGNIPDLLQMIVEVVKNEDIKTKHRVFLSAILSYVFNPLDIIPEIDSPFWGWIDDGVIVCESLNYSIEYGLPFPLTDIEMKRLTEIAAKIKSSLLPEFSIRIDRFLKDMKKNP
jgi:uncharacterized membrane protein YkvA (DUF1232 family)